VGEHLCPIRARVRGDVGNGVPEGRLDALADQRIAAVEALGGVSSGSVVGL